MYMVSVSGRYAGEWERSSRHCSRMKSVMFRVSEDVIMEFMWFQNCLTDKGLQPAGYLVDVHDEQEAIREAKQIATMAKP